MKASMIAYHGDPAIKAFYVARVQAHQIADQIVQGSYWSNGKGCAIGCASHHSHGNHRGLEKEIGVPYQILYLCDRIFEKLANREAKAFPLAFYTAIPTGADLSHVFAQFMVWLLSDEQNGMIRFVESEQGKIANASVVACYKRLLAGEVVSTVDWLKARRLAAAAAYATVADAYAAKAVAIADAKAVAYADAAYAKAVATAAATADVAYAKAVAYTAAIAYTATADAKAVATAAATADVAYAKAVAYTITFAIAYTIAFAAAATDADARQAYFQKMRDKLLELLMNAPVDPQRLV